MRTIGEKLKTTQRIKSAASTARYRPDGGQSRDVRSILHLQRTVGNQAVRRLLQAQHASLEVGRTTKVTRFGHGLSQGLARRRVERNSARQQLMAHELKRPMRPSGAWNMGAAPGVKKHHSVPNGAPETAVIARQPATPGWKDAPPKTPNSMETIVDDKGNILQADKAAIKGVRRIPIQDLPHGFKGTEKGPAFESPEQRAVVLIPNTVKPAASDKNKQVSVDVLLHLHGHGVGYRQLRPGQHDAPNVLKEGELRDVKLYEMEQQLLSHVANSQKFIIAVLPQGSELSAFGKVGANSDAYLQEVFDKLIPKYLPENAVPGRVIVSGHSGGGPTAMTIANQREQAGKRTDVFLFDAINSSCVKEEKKVDGETVLGKDNKPVMVCKTPKVCTSNEYPTASKWVTDRIKADVQSLNATPEDRRAADLKTNGTRFRGITSESLSTKSTCSYGHWYNLLKNDIEKTIKDLKVSEDVRKQLHQNYRVLEVKQSHERIVESNNLEDALKD